MTPVNKPKWITHGIRKCCKKKRDLLWKSRILPTADNKSEFKQYSTKLKQIMKLCY